MSPYKGLFPLYCHGNKYQLQFGWAFSSMFLCSGAEMLICLIIAGIEGQLTLMGLFGVQSSNKKCLAICVIEGHGGLFGVQRSN